MQKYLSTVMTLAALALAVASFSGCASTRAACGPAPEPCPSCPACPTCPAPTPCPSCGDKMK